jgi:hypothetical protein
MGMMDFVRSSYDLGEQFTETRLQTKDIEDYGIGGTMSQYWISPDGYLYLIDYSHTADFVELKEGDEGYSDKVPLFNLKWIPNGTHGKVRVHPITKYIEIYPEQWGGEWKEWPTLKLHFKYGKLQDYEDITGQR